MAEPNAPQTDGAGEGTSAPHRHPRVRKVFKWLAIVTVLLVVAGSAAGFYLYQHLQGNIGVLDVMNSGFLGTNRPTKASADPNAGREPMNILVMGSDTRQGQGLGYGRDISGARSDTTLLVHLPADRKSALVVSIPRDTIVDVPSCKTSSGDSAPYRDRFNSAFSTGGPACTIKTVEQDTGVFIDHFIIVDFQGFQDVIDALGGVQVCLPEDVNEPKSGLVLPAGISTVSGDQALAFVRVRAIGTGSDIDRISRQQAFLSSVIDKAKSSGTLFNPIRLYKFLDAATKSLTTDPGLANLNKMRELAQEVRGIPTKNIHFLTTPWRYNPEDPNTVVWKKQKTNQLWNAIIHDEPYPPEPPDPTIMDGKPLTAFPADMQLRVLNGTAVSGVATSASDELQRQGYNVVGVGDAGTSDFLRTTIRYDPADPDAANQARTLAAAIPGAVRVQRAGLGSVVEVVVGKSWPGVDKVVVKKSAAGSGIRKASENICNVPG
jgi:LCP family protein required for cell wall assembly